ncbi:MAG: hypothetical protein ACOX5F_08790 [Anaerovoracaceae bacterium]|jgi:flagellin-specific chaperone FliS
MAYKNRFDPECITYTDENIIFNTRLYWRQMVYWTRVYFNSVFAGIGSEEEVFARLYETPTRFVGAWEFVLGRPSAETYLFLLNEYVILLRQLVEAVMSGDLDAINENLDLLNENIEARAEFLAETFPTLEKDVLREMLKTFLQYEIEEINANVNQDYERIIEIYDNLIQQTNIMSDYLSKGIIDLITYRGIEPIGQEIPKSVHTSGCITYEELNTILSIAMFWVELVEWFRAYRISLVAGLGDQEALYERMIQHTVNFGNALKQFLEDEEFVDHFISLIQEYINLVSNLLQARLENNVEEADQAFRSILENIEQRARIISTVMPTLDERAWYNQLLRINTNLIEMGTALISGDFERNIQLFDALETQAEGLGFYFTENLFDLFN